MWHSELKRRFEGKKARSEEGNDEKTLEGKVELSLDDLEGAAGGFILDTGDGHYSTVDKPDGTVYY